MAPLKGRPTPILSVLQRRRDHRRETKRKWTSCFLPGIRYSASKSRPNWLACMASTQGNASTDRHAEGGTASPVSPLGPAKDTSARGSVTKNTPQSRNHGAARSRRSAPASTDALPLDRRRRPSNPDASEEPGDKPQIVPRGHMRQRRIYKKERASRRLAGQVPEFGLLAGRGETQSFYKASLQSSNTRKMSSKGARNGRLLKKPTAEGAKPQGISKYGQKRTNRSKRSMR